MAVWDGMVSDTSVVKGTSASASFEICSVEKGTVSVGKLSNSVACRIADEKIVAINKKSNKVHNNMFLLLFE